MVNIIIGHFRTVLLTRCLVFSARKYTEQHEWIEVQGKIGTVGVTDYAQGALGDVVFAQLPEPDTELNQMGRFIVSQCMC